MQSLSFSVKKVVQQRTFMIDCVPCSGTVRRLTAVTSRVVFEAEASGGSKAGGLPTLPFPLSLPSPFSSPPSFQTNQWEGRSDPVRGKFPGFPLQIPPCLPDGQLSFGVDLSRSKMTRGPAGRLTLSIRL